LAMLPSRSGRSDGPFGEGAGALALSDWVAILVARQRLVRIAMPELIPSDGLVRRARRICRRERARLDELAVGGELRLVGGTSMPGLVTYGDVDLLLRVPRQQFREVTARLGAAYPARLQSAWSESLWLFLIDPTIPVELALTPIGSQQDQHFVRAWELLARRSDLRERYNRLKLESSEADYPAMKGRFFKELADDAY